MDYQKIIIAVFMNLVLIFILSLIIYTGIRKYREKRLSYEKTSLFIFKEILTDTDVILFLICAALFYYFTFPFIQDIPYLTGQNHEEASGTVIQCNADSMIAEVTYGDDMTERIEIEGSYDLARGEEIVVRYLPHADVRIEWYVLDSETGKPVYLENETDSLLDSKAFMLCMALGCPLTVKFILLIFLKKMEEEEEQDRRRHLKMLKYAEDTARVIGALCVLRLISLNL